MSICRLIPPTEPLAMLLSSNRTTRCEFMTAFSYVSHTIVSDSLSRVALEMNLEIPEISSSSADLIDKAPSPSVVDNTPSDMSVTSKPSTSLAATSEPSMPTTLESSTSTTVQPSKSKASKQSKSTSVQPGPSTAPKKATKMRPGPGRNGRYVCPLLWTSVLKGATEFSCRNLCAHRWLITLKGTSGGSKEEFDEYYKSLSDKQRKVSARILDYLFYIP